MASTDSQLFRQEALKHFLRSEDGRGVVTISPLWSWALMWFVLLFVLTALTASFVGHVEVTGRGRGIVRPIHGIRVLVSQANGTVRYIPVRSGQSVGAGTLLVALDVANYQSQRLEAERQIEAIQTDYRHLSGLQDAAFRDQARRIKARIGQAQSQIQSYQQSVLIYERRLSAKRTLEKEGLVSALEVDEAREALGQIQRQLASAQQQWDQAWQEQAALESHRQDELWQRKQVVQNAETKRDALIFMNGQKEITAPEDGVVEALLVKAGEVVQPGQAVCKLIPGQASLQVISFLAEKDRAFVNPGDTVHLELEQLPYAEYGTLKARVIRISDDLASPYEVREALGEDQKLETPAYRAELEIFDATVLDRARVKLRTGTLMNVRYTLRRQRLITLVLDPLRKWFK